VSADPVSARYTEALYELAAEKGALEDVRRGVERIAAEVSDPSVAQRLFDARVPGRARRGRMVELARAQHPLLGSFVALLFDKRREEVLRTLGPAFRRRWLSGRGAVEGRVESARALSTGEIARLAAALGARLQREVLLANTIEPELVGGVRVLIANRLIDHSVRGRLGGLRRRLSEARLPHA